MTRHASFDAQVVEGSKRCSRCGKAKPVAQFYYLPKRGYLASWCKACVRIGVGSRYGTPEEVATRKAYRSRPEVADRLRQTDRERAEARRPKQAAYRKTPRAKLLHCRRNARARLLRATDPAKIARLNDLIDACTREIDRLAELYRGEHS